MSFHARARNMVLQLMGEHGTQITLTREQFADAIATAMARGKHGDKVAYVDKHGTARDVEGRHFHGLGQGADAARY